MSQRMKKRINHTIQEVISTILMTEVKDEEIKFVTITGVDTSSDLSYAKIYFTCALEIDKNTIETAFEIWYYKFPVSRKCCRKWVTRLQWSHSIHSGIYIS